MKVFQFNPIDGVICPVCGKNDVKDSTLVPIHGTMEGNNAVAVQVHMECLTNDLWLYPGPEGSLIANPAPFYTTSESDYEG